MHQIQEPKQVPRLWSPRGGLRGLLSYREEWLTDKQGLVDPIYLVTSAFSRLLHLLFDLLFLSEKNCSISRYLAHGSFTHSASECHHSDSLLNWHEWQIVQTTGFPSILACSRVFCWQELLQGTEVQLVPKELPKIFKPPPGTMQMSALALSSHKIQHFTFSFFLYVFWLFNYDCFEWTEGGMQERQHT